MTVQFRPASPAPIQTVRFGANTSLAIELAKAIKDAGGPEVRINHSPGSTKEQNKSGYPHLDNLPPFISIVVLPNSRDRKKFAELLKVLDRIAPEVLENGKPTRRFKGVEVLPYIPEPPQLFNK